MIELATQGEAVLLPVKVVPGASRTRCLGELDGRLKIAVAAAPEKGKANKTVISYLAGLIGVAKRDLSIVSGATSPVKTIKIEHADADKIRSALRRAQS